VPFCPVHCYHYVFTRVFIEQINDDDDDDDDKETDKRPINVVGIPTTCTSGGRIKTINYRVTCDESVLRTQCAC